MNIIYLLSLTAVVAAMKPYYQYGSECRDNANLHGLERDILQCNYTGNEGFIRGLKLARHECNSGDMRFRMLCEYNHTESESCSVTRTTCDDLEGKSLNHLTNHDAECGPGTAITQWGLSSWGCSSSKMRLRYKCCEASDYDTDSAYSKSTSCQEVSGKKIGAISDFGNEIKCGNNEVMTSLKLATSGCASGKAKFVLKCAPEVSEPVADNNPPVASLAVRAIEHAGVVCQAVLYDHTPPAFCYKKGADFGIPITGCKDGYVKLGALCYRKCKDGYSRHTNNVCAAGCGKGWKAFGIKLCKKRGNWGKWKSRKTYWVMGHGLGSHGACNRGRYKQGALCYRDCNNIGLQNCGIGGCSYSGVKCGTEIWNKINKASTGALTAFSFASTLGASFGSTTLSASLSAKLAGASYGSYILTKEMEVLFEALTKESFEKATLNKMTERASRKIDAHSFHVLGEEGVRETCEDMYALAKRKAQNFSPRFQSNMDNYASAFLDMAVWPVLDTFKIGEAVEGCTKTDGQGGANYRRLCATAVIDSIATVDPTGVAMMISSLMGGICDVPGRPFR